MGFFSAKLSDVIIMNEAGLDPGIDHMLAMECIDEIHQRGGKVFRFILYFHIVRMVVFFKYHFSVLHDKFIFFLDQIFRKFLWWFASSRIFRQSLTL